MKKRHFLAALAASTLARGTDTTDWDAKPLREIVIPNDSKRTLVQWYKELLTHDSDIRSQFSRLTRKARESSRDLQEDEPESIEWLPSGDTHGREHYQNKVGYLIFHSISQNRPHHDNERLDIIVSEARIVEDVSEDKDQNPTIVKRTFQFLGFRELTLKKV